MKNETKSTAVATINNQQILIIENGEKRVAIKPICDALGINYSSQLQKLKADEILSSTMVLSTTVGADGKQREMQTIPFKFVFGWLFRIDSRNVKPEAKEAVLKYQLECYNALYAHFTELDEYLTYRTALAEKVFDQMEAARDDFKQAKSRLDTLKSEFTEARSLTIETYREHKAQLALNFEEANQLFPTDTSGVYNFTLKDQGVKQFEAKSFSGFCDLISQKYKPEDILKFQSPWGDSFEFDYAVIYEWLSRGGNDLNLMRAMLISDTKGGQ